MSKIQNFQVIHLTLNQCTLALQKRHLRNWWKCCWLTTGVVWNGNVNFAHQFYLVTFIKVLFAYTSLLLRPVLLLFSQVLLKSNHHNSGDCFIGGLEAQKNNGPSGPPAHCCHAAISGVTPFDSWTRWLPADAGVCWTTPYITVTDALDSNERWDEGQGI